MSEPDETGVEFIRRKMNKAEAKLEGAVRDAELSTLRQQVKQATYDNEAFAGLRQANVGLKMNCIALQQEVERLRRVTREAFTAGARCMAECQQDVERAWIHYQQDALTRERDDLRARLKAVTADAAHYGWLRSEVVDVGVMAVMDEQGIVFKSSEQMDRAADTALAALKPEGAAKS